MDLCFKRDIFWIHRNFKVGVKESSRVSVVLIPADLPRSNSTCFTYPTYVRRSGSESNAVLISPLCAPLWERGRGSPRFAKHVDLRFQEVETCGRISYEREKGGFRALRDLSTNNVHRRCSSSNPTTPGDRGDTTISNRVLPLSFVLFLSSLFHPSLRVAVLIIPCLFKIRWRPATNRSKTIDKP